MTKAPRTPSQPIPHIGAFVLETLTLGMYGEPKHTLREYIQNSFDSIRAAQRARYLSGRGRIDVRIADESITIRDNGLGVRADQAWTTLTSVGASKKDRKRDAGFRGIGRLAGMAYCDELVFRTTFPGERTLSIVHFDCAKLTKAMEPDEGGDIELADLLASAITFDQKENAVEPGSHFFEVVLQGLDRAPGVIDYLSETAPVEFNPTWSRRADIEAKHKAYFGALLETVDVFVTSGTAETQVFKPYGETYEFAKGVTRMKDISFYSDDDGSYWGWVGRLDQSAAVTDKRTRGLRVRVRNIQVDGTEMFETLFAEVKQSYGRFSSYYVGEIHIAPDRVIPNARRDGFEETDTWLVIQASLKETVCQPLSAEAYQESQKGQSNIKKVVDDIEELVTKSHRLADNSRASYDQVVDLMQNARRLRQKASSALRVVAELDEGAAEDESGRFGIKTSTLQEATKTVEVVESQARMLIGRFLDDDDKIEGLRARLRQEVVEEVLAVVSAFVDHATYQKIRRQLLKKTA